MLLLRSPRLRAPTRCACTRPDRRCAQSQSVGRCGLIAGGNPHRVLAEVGEYGGERVGTLRGEEAPATFRRQALLQRRQLLGRVARRVETHRDEVDSARELRVLREQAIESHQRHVEVDEPEEDNMALLMGGSESAPMATPDDLDEEKLLRALMAEQDRK